MATFPVKLPERVGGKFQNSARVQASKMGTNTLHKAGGSVMPFFESIVP
jgi:hypothetical protein